MDETRSRLAEEVLQDHLRESRSGSVEDDLKRNYAEEVALLTGRGLYRGHDGMRELNRRLMEELPNARFEYRTRLVDGEMGFLEWAAEADGARVEDGADSYLIRSGRIVAQTIHYTVRRDRSDAQNPGRGE
jgi:hypothetical protein